MCLEKHLLSMYRKTFGKCLESLSKTNSTPNERRLSELKEQNGKSKENQMTNTSPILPPLSNPIKECDDTKKLVDSTILRCHSSLSHAAFSFRASPSIAALAEAVDSYHSLPLSMLEHAQLSTSNRSLAEHFVTSCFNNYHGSPSQLSEEMIKCISAIYCQFADPPFFGYDLSLSPISVSSSFPSSSG
nr:uncharacterized protein LOC104099682 [Nicotiana tomentosiformis]XP_018627464.1 uncharacterized protein LOC104099682 [Nicotiana tomentosiformis]